LHPLLATKRDSPFEPDQCAGLAVCLGHASWQFASECETVRLVVDEPTDLFADTLVVKS